MIKLYRVLGLFGLVVGFLVAAPQTAWAQRCPPGIPGGGNPACIPPDILTGNSGGDSSREAPVDPSFAGWTVSEKQEPTYAAVAWHPDSTEFWAVWKAIDSLPATQSMALDACNKVMRKGCRVGMSSTGGSIAMGYAQSGYGQKGWGKTKKEALKSMHDGCLQSTGLECREFETITSDPLIWHVVKIDKTTVYFPENGGLARFGAIASPEQDPTDTKWQGYVWLVTGEPTYAAATDKALARCKAATGMTCRVDAHGVNTNLVLYTTKDDMFFWSHGLSRKDGEKSVARNCKSRHKGKKCAVVNFFDTQTPRDEMIGLEYPAG